MRVLLDTHSFLWFLSGDSELTHQFRLIIENPQSEIIDYHKYIIMHYGKIEKLTSCEILQ